LKRCRNFIQESQGDVELLTFIKTEHCDIDTIICKFYSEKKRDCMDSAADITAHQFQLSGGSSFRTFLPAWAFPSTLKRMKGQGVAVDDAHH
jgi:uncharacterized radical SAM superfamily protein